VLRTAVAIGVYACFWIAVLFGYLSVDSSGGLYDVLRALAIVVPALALGALVGRWWVVLAGLVFLLAVPLPERTTLEGSGIDVTLTGVHDVSLNEALELIALTTPWVLLGVIARRRAERSTAASEPEAGTTSEARASSAPS
jgi:hypothetical protein